MDTFFINSGFAICGLIMMILLMLIFVSKTRIWSLQSGTFFLAGATTILILVFEILLSRTIPEPSLYDLNVILSRIYLFLNIFWFFISTAYISAIFINKENKSRLKKITIIYFVISVIAALLFALLYSLKFDVCESEHTCFIGGYYHILITIIAAISSSAHASILFFNRKKIKNLNMLPLVFLSFVFLGGNGFLYLINEKVNVLSITFVFTITILFLTIENQDSKLLDEYEKYQKESVKTGKAKTEFLINMSHKIRTPLTTIMGFGQSLLNKENLNEEALRSDLKNIKHANNTLLELINSLSDMAKLEGNKIIISESDYNLDSLIFEIYSIIPPRINKDNLKFTIEANPNIPKKFYGDASLIFKSICYIILNAVEHTEYGEVLLKVDAKKGDNANYEIEFIIQNTGHAMREEDFALDLDNYIKLNDKDDNINLGLIIAKKIIDILNGSIEFINRKGEGTRYIVKFNQKNYTEEEKIGDIFASNTGHESLLSNIIDYKGKKVLLVDDKPDNLSVMEDYLKNYNVDIKIAKNGKDAIASIQRERFDLVFLDNLMPDINGTEVIKTLKTLLKNLPPIILTVNNYETNIDQKEYGFDDVLTKPVVFKNLNKIMNKYLKK